MEDAIATENLVQTDDGTNGEEVGERKPIVLRKCLNYRLRQKNLKEDELNLMAAGKTETSKVEYAPRVISGELAFLIRSALTTAVFGEQGLGWRGTSWRMADEFKRKDIGGKAENDQYLR